MNRRNLLKAVGTTSIGAVGLNNITRLSKASEDQVERELTTLEGKERHKTLKNARHTDEVKKLTKKYKNEGWIPRFSQSKCRRVEPEDVSPFEVVVIPFEKKTKATGSKQDGNQTVIIWKSRNANAGTDRTVTGHQLVEDGSPNDSGREIKEVNHHWEQGEITEQSNRSEIRSADGISTQDNLPGGGGGGGCIYLDTYCVNFNLSCIGLIVGALGLGCGSTGMVGCLATALLEGGAYYTGDGCNVCDEYTTEAKTKPVCNCPSCY